MEKIQERSTAGKRTGWFSGTDKLGKQPVPLISARWHYAAKSWYSFFTKPLTLRREI
jgi:hypothetical protein